LELIVDSREPPKMRRILRTLKIPFVVRKLDAGDYEIGECVFERKTLMDFVQSIRGNSMRVGGRIFDQMDTLMEYCEENNKIPFLMVSGELADLEEIFAKFGREVNLNAIYGAIASIVVRYGINVIQCRGDAELVEVMLKIATKVHEGKLGLPHRKSFRKVHRNRKVAHIANVLRVGPKVAERLYKKFGGIYGVLMASDQELLGVEGIGPVTLARIKALLGKEDDKPL